jgi:nitrogen fixation/metabolism regulation signal transduction histidine kinase
MKAAPKTQNLYVAGGFLLALALLVFVQAALNLNPFINPSEPNQILILYALSTFIFLVLLVFGFVLSRTLIKVWVERKQQKPGSHFKTSLLVSLILLTLVPATLLFLFAFGLVNRSIDKWFSVPADQAFLAATEITRQWRAEHEQIGSRIITELAHQLPQDLEGARQNFQMKALMVIDAQGKVINSSADNDIDRDRLALQILEGLGNQEQTTIHTPTFWVNARRIGQTQILAAAFQPPAGLVALSDEIAAQRANYSELVQNRKAYRDIYVYILLLMTVLALFASRCRSRRCR